VLVSFVQAQAYLGVGTLTDLFSNLVVFKAAGILGFLSRLFPALAVKTNWHLGPLRLGSCRTQPSSRPVTITHLVEEGVSISILASNAVQPLSLRIKRYLVTAGCSLFYVSFVVVSGIFLCFLSRILI